MKIQLKEFQEDAVAALYSAIADARTRAKNGRLEAVTLSAPTGSGKTVVATRLIELTLQGDETHNPDPEAIFLWITDQPELNVQTRDKMRATSDVLGPSNTVDIGPGFDEPIFPGGKVYFLNTQKLATSSSYVKPGDNRTYTLWETIQRTAEEKPDQFFVIIDEAHRGARLDKDEAEEANTIMQKFVLGSPEITPIPIILGISATLDRFTALLAAGAKAKAARTHQPVNVDPLDVIESGLLKKKVILHNPKQTQGAEFPLLRDAVRAWDDMRGRWAAYCADQGEEAAVEPILLIQVEDGTKTKLSRTDIDAVVAAVREEVPSLEIDDFAHAFQDGQPADLENGTSIRYLAPSSIDADPTVKVVLFKTSLNTGWDCPRAEVMMSFRVAKDSTHIAQLVGRMVRAPLARSIDQDDVLNSVSLMLPNFDGAEVDRVVQQLTSDDAAAPLTKVEKASNRIVLKQADGFAPYFEAADALPTYIVAKRPQGNQIQRLGALADALAQTGLRPGAGAEARDYLTDVLEEEYNKRKNQSAYKALVKSQGTISVRPLVLRYGTTSTEAAEAREVPVSDEMVDEVYEWARKKLGLDLGLRYWKRKAATDDSHDHKLTKLQLYALAADSGITHKLEQAAASKVSTWLAEYKVQISHLNESQRARFAEIKRQAAEPTLDNMDVSTRLTLDHSVPAGAKWLTKHLYQNDDGLFPEKLNTWEAAVLDEELARGDVVAWLRNPSNLPWGLSAPYEMGSKWKSCYPDFIIFREVDGHIVADVVDPHLISLEDAAYKAAGLARFAEKHQDAFGRFQLIVVESAGKEGQRVRRLDLMNEQTREKVKGVSSIQHLRDLFDLVEA
jgi:type III restriction enzyme